MENATVKKIDLSAELTPETALERAFLNDPAFTKGCHWGVPRFGHPEGEVYKHIKEVLQNIDRYEIDPSDRAKLRIIAFVHDTFKYLEHKGRPRDWSKHHSIIARKFLEKYTNDEDLLIITELHDEAYYIWRLWHVYQEAEKAQAKLARLLHQLGDRIQLYYLFFKADTLTGDKNLAPLKWFEQTIPGIQLTELGSQ